jgi:hypothetical protein
MLHVYTDKDYSAACSGDKDYEQFGRYNVMALEATQVLSASYLRVTMR